MSREQLEYAVAGLVLFAACAAAVAAVAFLIVPLADYSWSWWRIVLE